MAIYDVDVVAFLISLVISVSPMVASVTTSCKTCQSPPSDDITLCRCDDQCTLYGDCCPDHSAGSLVINDSLSTTVGYMECHSRYRSLPVLAVGDAYYMVSSCPSNWTQDEQFIDLISNNCTSTDPDVEDFPPVSDPSTGITYRNEFCAICHNVNTPTLLTWPTRLRCEGDFKNISQTQNITLDLIYQYCSRCSFDPPNSTVVMDTLRWCIPVEAMCPPFSQPGISDIYSETEYEEIVDSCTNGEYNPIHELCIFPNSSLLHIYKNSKCAECNMFSNDSVVQCTYPIVERYCKNDTTNMTLTNGVEVLSVLLVITGSGAVYAISSSSQINGTEVIRCDKYQLFNSVLGCTDIVCPSGHILVSEKCLPNNTTMESSTLYNCTIVPLDGDDYVIVDNSSIQFGEEVIDVLGYDNNGRPLICNDSNTSSGHGMMSSDALPGYYEMVFIGGTVSITASTLILVTYSIFSEFRSFPIILLMNLAVAFLVSDVVLVFGGIVSLYLNSVAFLCAVEPILVHYSLLARFSWMNCLGFEYIRRYFSVYRLEINTENEKQKTQQCKNLVCYMLFGWGVPLVITLITVIVNFSREGLVDYGNNASAEQVTQCWIANNNAEIIAIAVPISLGILINFIMFLIVVVLMCVVSRNSIKELQKKRRLAQIRLVFGILFVLGGTWLFAFIGFIVADDAYWTSYTFFIADSSQSVLVAITFLTTKRIIRKYWALLRCNSLANIIKHVGKSSTTGDVIVIEM